MLWNGETWLCEECGTYNAVIRERCRTCLTDNPGPYHEDPAIDREVRAEVAENIERDYARGLLPYQQKNWTRPPKGWRHPNHG